MVLLPRVKESEGAEGRLKSAENAAPETSKTAAAQARAIARISKRRNKRSGVVVNFGSKVMKRKMTDFASFLGEGGCLTAENARITERERD